MNTKKNVTNTLKVFYSVCKAMQVIQGLLITHYDIKADNIMMGEEGPVIVDYGESLQNE